MNKLKDPKKDNWLYRLYGGDFVWGYFKYEVLKKIFLWMIVTGLVLPIIFGGLSIEIKNIFSVIFLSSFLVYVFSLFYSKKLSNYLFIEGTTAQDAKWTLIWLGSTAILVIAVTIFELIN